MKPKLEEQLRRYRHDFEAAQAEIRLDDVRTRRSLQPAQPGHQPRGWLVAAGVAASTLLLVGGVTLSLGLLTSGDPAIDEIPRPTVTVSTTVPPSTTEPASTTVPPDGAAHFAAQLFTAAHGLPEAGLLEVAVDADGTVWAIGPDLYRLDGTTWTLASETVPVSGIEWMVSAPGGGVIVGAGPSCDVALFDGEEWTSLDEIPALARCSAQSGPDDTTWIFGYDEDLAPTLIAVGESGAVVHPPGPIPGSFPVAEFRLTFDIAPDGTFWYGTPEGAWNHDGTNLTFHPLEAPDGCCPPSLAVGPSGDVWVQLGADVFRYRGAEWTRFTADDGLPDFLDEQAGLAIVVPTSDGSVWIATDTILTHFDGDKWTTDPSSETVLRGGGSGVSVDSPDASTWVLGRTSGQNWWLSRFADGSWQAGNLGTMQWAEPSPGAIDVNRPDLYNRPLAVGPDGSAWIATSRGIARIAPVE